MSKGFIIVTCMVLLSSCAPYLEQSRPALRAYYESDFSGAAGLADGIHPRKADKLLAYLDKATIYHAAKLFNKSIKHFEKALDLAEAYEKQAALPQVGAVFTNDNVLPYVAGPYERLLIHVFQIINYSSQGAYEDSLVEVRRINTLFPDIYSDQEKRSYMKSLFNAYLSGLIWEAGGLCNDAYIDYNRVRKLRKGDIDIERDIERAGVCAGLIAGKPAGGKAVRSNDGPPNLIVILELGRSPVKVSSEYNLPLQVIPVPLYEDKSTAVKKVSIIIDGRRMGQALQLEDIGSSLKKVLEDEMPSILARAMARLAVKEGAAVAIGEKVDKKLGEMLGVMALMTNRADTRSWQTLPNTFHIWRGLIPAGSHRISLEFLDDSGRKVSSLAEYVEIRKGEEKLLVYRNVE